MGLPRDQAKILILKIINGGMTEYNALAAPPNDLRKFTEEIPKIHELVVERHPNNIKSLEKEKKSLANVKASFMNIILCDIENKILQEIFEYYGNDKSASLIFDGLMLKKGREYDFEACEQHR